MLELSGVTLACVDTLNHALALRALARSREHIMYGRTLLLTDRLPSGVHADEGIDVVPIEPLRSRDDYSQFVLKRLLPHIATRHVLLIQWDGYVVNAAAWESAFADCDYLGARWFWHHDGRDVGNGGFSLRSRRLLEVLQDPRIVLTEAEDMTIGRTFRDLLEREHAVRFGSGALADRFAFEAAYPIGRPFGFHGLYNFCRVVPSAELAALAIGFDDAIARSMQFVQLLRNCVAMGRWQPAIAIAKRILAAEAPHEEARALLQQSEEALARGIGVGRNDPCPCGSGLRYKQCHGAVGTAPPNPDALVARAIEAHQRGELDQAASGYRAALALEATHPLALHYLGMIGYQRGDASGALPMLEQAVARVPDEPEFHNNLGLVLAALDHNAKAVDAHRRAIALRGDHAGAWNNLGLALQLSNDLDGAIDAFRHALALAPGFDQARFNLALALLLAGRFEEGWPAYEARLKVPSFRSGSAPGTPLWDGRDAAGRTLLLTCEQGLGDAIQFIRLATVLARRGARVAVQAPRTLVALFSTVRGVAEVVPADAPPPRHDAWLPLLSLAGVLGIDATTIPAEVPYLAADPARRREVSAALRERPVVVRAGVAWAGNPRNTNDRRRSMTLPTLAPLFDLPGVDWYSLQWEEGEGAVVAAERRPIALPCRNDFDGLAALVAELDLVVTVDTSIAHLAGALAKPVYLLLPFAPDWRWRLARSDSDWYPTARLFRQPSPGDWRSVVAAVRRELGSDPRVRPCSQP